MLNGDCNTCHISGPRFPVILDSSSGGSGFDPISCMGCHGRAQDDSVANGGACVTADCSPGAGLQQHHFNAGVTICEGCHNNADPNNYLPVGEDVPPPYYFTPDADHPDKPSDPCDDNFIGGPTGLDNDGDGDYDGADSDCIPECTVDDDCDNGDFCDGAETCDQATGQCLPGTPVNVDDGVGCTDDSCDDVNDVVVNTPNDGLCDNGEFCDGAETCDAGNDCQAGTQPCDPATETCDDIGDVCEPLGCQSDADCDNGDFCDGAETCDIGTGQCLPGTAVDVDDGVGCTDDSCDEANDVVVNTPNDGICDNGEFCDGAETCDAVNDCQAGTPPCDPATETCDETNEICVEPIFIDLDIAKFSAPKSVRLAKVKPVEIKLVVKNSGDFNSQTREATVTGMQNGLKVYEETQNVSDDLGNGRSTFKFGPYTPTATGDILWSATIADDDPDDDTATAVTTVK